MLNLFAATDHIKYAKCLRLYLQEMQRLPEEHPVFSAQFMGGHHTVKRTKRVFAHLWTDLAIEQTLMRSAKSKSGLTHGRGLNEGVRLVIYLCKHKPCSRKR